MWRRLATGGCVVAVAPGIVGVPTVVAAQPSANVHRIGWLGNGSPRSGPDRNGGEFQQGLRDLGHVEGQNLKVDNGYFLSDSDTDRNVRVLVRTVKQ